MVFCIYQFKATRVNARNIQDILSSVIQSTRFKKGCISSDLWLSRTDTGALLLYEVWESVENLRKHIISPLYRKVLASIELCNEQPDIKFIESNNVRSLDFIEQTLIEIPNSYLI